MPTEKTLICIVGPTAIGKTTLSIEIAKAFNTEIISADSRQFYREMSIGTAVPSEAELGTVTHHFIQSKSIFDPYSVGDFEREALEALEKLFKQNSYMVLVGGSGLYVDAVTKGLDRFPEVPEMVREQLREEFDEKGIEILQQELKTRDPQYYKRVDLMNPHRVIRALEVCRFSNKPYSSFLNDNNSDRGFKTLFIGLTADRELVYDRINLRVDQMLEEGLVEEARKLYGHSNLNALQTVGYRELFAYFDGDLSLEEAAEEIKKNSRRFAKRQYTWFRKNEDIHWFEYDSASEKIISFIKEKSA